jgi:mono/diheme cytochrome c family protein
MKSVKLHSPLSKLALSCLAFLLFFSLSLSAQEGNVENGEKLFKSTCAACHKLEGKLLGPSLKGIAEKRDQDWLISWIKDSPALIKSGDKLANEVFKENNMLPMPPNAHLSEQDIIDILAYTSGEKTVVKTVAATQDVDPGVEHGKQLFKTNCAACHKLEGKLIGPELLKIGDIREADWLKAWIKDNNALIASGDKLAKEVADSNPMMMTPFAHLSDQDLDDLLKYLEVGDAIKQVASTAIVAKDEEIFNKPGLGIWSTLGITISAFLLLSLIVAATTKKKVVEGEESTGNMLKSLIFNPFIRFLSLIFFLLLGAWLVFGWFMQIDVNEGYQPIQPIAFSHAVHAGDNKVDCQYCHSSAKNSKTSGIPSANVCMNCHKTISEYNGEPFGEFTKEDLDSEIQKIYNAVGWDKDNMKYIENYEQKPVEWVRIHNLADFVYYNHSQHVTVAGLDCKKCHGPVEEMHVVEQYSPLTMDWCVTCHRETQVDMTENKYYENIHNQLAKKYGVEKVTEAQLGGLECGKCHY